MVTFVFVSEFWNFKTGVDLAAGASHLGCVLDLTPDSEVDMMFMDLRAAGNWFRNGFLGEWTEERNITVTNGKIRM